ncbi:MAG: PorP/SprF family type IX secretion system membrane protein [Bacteroidia bacterium]
MKKFNLSILLILPLLTIAQDVHFSQYYETPLIINPASAGFYDGRQRAVLNYKNQWQGIPNPFVTMAASFDMPLFESNKRNAHLGIGLNAYRDQAGDAKFGTTQINLSVSGIVKLNPNHKISVGMQGGGAQRSANFSNLEWGNQFIGNGFNTNLVSNEINTLNSFLYGDLSAGIFYEYSNIENSFASKDVFKFNLGLSGFHLNKPDLNFYNGASDKLHTRYVLHSSLRYDIPESRLSLVPMAMYAMQGPSSELLASMLFRISLSESGKITTFFKESALSFGCGVRSGDAIIPQVMIEFHDYSFGVSYDLKAGAKSYGINGGLELFLRYTNWKGPLYKGKK